MGRKPCPILLGIPPSASSYGRATAGSRCCWPSGALPVGPARAWRVARGRPRARRRHGRARASRATRDARSGRRRPRDRVSRARTVRHASSTATGAASAGCRASRRDDAAIVAAAQARLRAKLSYTNIGFALAPATFTISELRQVYVAALGHDVAATNLQRVLLRRGVLERIEGLRPSGRAGGRPAAVFRFASQRLEVTDAFATCAHPAEAGHAWSRPVPSPNQGVKSVTFLPLGYRAGSGRAASARMSRQRLKRIWCVPGSSRSVASGSDAFVVAADRRAGRPCRPRPTRASPARARPRARSPTAGRGTASSRASHSPPCRNDSTRPAGTQRPSSGSPGRRRRPLAPRLERAGGDARRERRGRASHAARRAPARRRRSAARHRADERHARDPLGRDRGQRKRVRPARRPADDREPVRLDARQQRPRPTPGASRAARPARTGRRRAAARRAPRRSRRPDAARGASRRRRASRRPGAGRVADVVER